MSDRGSSKALMTGGLNSWRLKMSGLADSIPARIWSYCVLPPHTLWVMTVKGCPVVFTGNLGRYNSPHNRRKMGMGINSRIEIARLRSSKARDRSKSKGMKSQG
jgi:hypothetical protein